MPIGLAKSQSRVVVSCTLKNAEKLLTEIKALNVPYEYLGIVTENNIDMEGEYWGHIDDWKELYDTAIEKMLSGAAPALKGGEGEEPNNFKKEAEEQAITEKGEVKGV